MSEEPVSFSFTFLIPEKHKTFSALLTCCVFSNLNYPFPYIIYLTLSSLFVFPCDSTGIVALAINGSHVLLESYGDSWGGLDVRSHGKWRVDLDKLRLKRVVMALETLKSDAFSNFIIYDTISATPFSSHDYAEASFVAENMNYQEHDPASAFDNCALMRTRKRQSSEPDQSIGRRQNNNVGVQVQVQGRKKGRRKPRFCKNKEEAETQRMTHIAVERNRRKQMNEHLAVLRSLMPESFVQRGDQASIVGGAIEFVKELEHLLQSLEARKLQLLEQEVAQTNEDTAISKLMRPPFAQFFVYPQYTWSQTPNKYTSKTKAAIADVEVTLIETHANLRILTQRSPRQLSKLVAGFQTLFLTILHLNVTTMDPVVLYSISAKVEEGFQLGSVDGIATAVHHLCKTSELGSQRREIGERT